MKLCGETLVALFFPPSMLSPAERNHLRPPVDSSNGMQIDNHVAGHKLPVIFCFREGGRLVQANEAGRGGDGEEVKAGCRFTMSLVSSWRRLRSSGPCEWTKPISCLSVVVESMS